MIHRAQLSLFDTAATDPGSTNTSEVQLDGLLTALPGCPRIAIAGNFVEDHMLGVAARMVLQVHDALAFDVPVSEVETVSRVIREEMCRAYPLAVKSSDSVTHVTQ